MKPSFFSRIATVIAWMLLAALALAFAMPAKPGYHLLKKYTFGAAEGSTASILTTSRSILLLAAFTCRIAQK